MSVYRYTYRNVTEEEKINMRILSGLLLAFLFALAGCKSSSNSSFEELSDDEKSMLVENARVIFVKYGKTEGLTLDEKLKQIEALKNKKDNTAKQSLARSFSEEDKFIVKKTNPQLRFYYSGDKEGRATVSWKLPNSRTVIFVASGRLLEKEKIWTMSVVNSEDLVVTPDARKALERSGSTLIEDLKSGKRFPAAQ